jgi:adenylyl-sulfate kinase
MIVETSSKTTKTDRVLSDSFHIAHRGITVWLTGLSGAGRSTIAHVVHAELIALGMRVQVLDADWLREHLSHDLGFSKKDRDENVRRIGFVADLLTQHDVIVLVAAISPYRATRNEIRVRIRNFIEVYVDAPLSVCEKRDPKGLYSKVRAGEIHNFTGIDDPYEQPLSPDLRLDTHEETLRESVDKVIKAVLSFML